MNDTLCPAALHAARKGITLGTTVDALGRVGRVVGFLTLVAEAAPLATDEQRQCALVDFSTADAAAFYVLGLDMHVHLLPVSLCLVWPV